MQIPDCYDPAIQEAARSLRYTAMVMRRPRCECCGLPVTTDQYLDLEPFGLKGIACERCRDGNSHWTDTLEVDG